MIRDQSLIRVNQEIGAATGFIVSSCETATSSTVLGREMCVETRALAIQRGLKPSHIGLSCSLQPKSAHLVGQNSKLG